MLRTLARILLLLLIAALPLQGVTAATMMVKGAAMSDGTGQQITSVGGHQGFVAASSDGGDDHCLGRASAVGVEQQGKAGKHAGHACPGCTACSLCSVVPYAFPLSVHLDDAPAQVPSSLMEAFVSHIPDALQRPPALLA